MLGLLLLPALLAGAASVAWAVDPRGPTGRALAAGAALVAGALAGLAPSGAWDGPWLLLGARTGLDPAGRGALVGAAGLLLLASRRRAGARPDAAPAWRALLAGGLCAAAVAFDAGVLAAGHVASLLATYGLALRGPGGRNAAARFMAAAVVGEVLLVDALAEFGHAAESTHLDVMRAAAAEELGLAAPLLLAAAFGLPLLLAGLERLPEPAGALGAVGALATSRLVSGPCMSGAAVAALALLGFAALAAAGGLLRRAAPSGRSDPEEGGRAADVAAPTVAGHPAARPASQAVAPRAALLGWLGRFEARLGRATGSGLLLLAIVVGLSLVLTLWR